MSLGDQLKGAADTTLETGKDVADAVGKGAGEAGSKFRQWLDKFTDGMNGWTLGGVGVIGLIGWVIGNAFGGGGILGLVIGGLLTAGLVTASNGSLPKQMGEHLKDLKEYFVGDASDGTRSVAQAIEPEAPVRTTENKVASPPRLTEIAMSQAHGAVSMGAVLTDEPVDSRFLQAQTRVQAPVQLG